MPPAAIHSTLRFGIALALAWLGALMPARGDANELLDSQFDRLVAEQGLEGAGLVILSEQGAIYQRVAGSMKLDTALQVASVSKWLTSATIMSLVDDGTLELDRQVRSYLPEAPQTFEGMTLRHLLSHTSGINPRLIRALRGLRSNEEVAKAILEAPLIAEPGSTFSYGGTSMQLASYIAERATSKSWDSLFRERLTKPLGITSATWANPLAAVAGRGGRARAESERSNFPLVAGGLSINLRDMATFMSMIVNRGLFEGKRVLSSDAIAEMERLQTASVRDFKRLPVAEWRYGLGIWCEEFDPAGTCTIVNSAGAFGAVPWVDRKRQRAGVFFALTRLNKVLGGVIALRSVSNDLVAQPTVPLQPLSGGPAKQ